MRKYTLLSALLFATCIITHAQEFTIRLSGGYAGPGLQNSESVLGPKVDPSTAGTDALVNLANVNDSLKTYKQIHASYGSGGNVTLGLGYMFNKYIGVDVGISYAHSNTISCLNVKQLPGFSPATYLYANISTFSYAVALTPSIVITAAKTGWKVYPYGRFAVVLPVAGKLTDNVSIDAPALVGSPFNINKEPFWLGGHTQAQLVTEATVSLGFGGALGVAYRPLPFMNVFLELNGQYLTVRAKESTVTQWTADGVSDLPSASNPAGTRSVYRTQINYVNQLNSQSNNADYNSNYDPTKPKQDTRPTVPASNLGFNAGVTFFLGKQSLKKKDKVTTSAKSQLH